MWEKKRKGYAVIHTHPDSYEGRAIVVDMKGITYNGVKYDSLAEAKKAALSIKEEHQSIPKN